MEKRSVKLSSDYVKKERTIFETYGLNNDSYSDNHKGLLDILFDNIDKAPLTPPKKYDIPDCKKFTDIDGKYHCVTGKRNKLVQYKTTHLAICTICVKQGGNIPLAEPEQNTEEAVTTIVLPEPVKVGEVPQLDKEGNEIYTPIQGYEKILFYVRSDGGKLCPFEKGLIAYKFVCKACEKNYPAKHESCLTLLRNHCKTNEVKT